MRYTAPKPPGLRLEKDAMSRCRSGISILGNNSAHLTTGCESKTTRLWGGAGLLAVDFWILLRYCILNRGFWTNTRNLRAISGLQGEPSYASDLTSGLGSANSRLVDSPEMRDYSWVDGLQYDSTRKHLWCAKRRWPWFTSIRQAQMLWSRFLKRWWQQGHRFRIQCLEAARESGRAHRFSLGHRL